MCDTIEVELVLVDKSPKSHKYVFAVDVLFVNVIVLDAHFGVSKLNDASGLK